MPLVSQRLKFFDCTLSDQLNENLSSTPLVLQEKERLLTRIKKHLLTDEALEHPETKNLREELKAIALKYNFGLSQTQVENFIIDMDYPSAKLLREVTEFHQQLINLKKEFWLDPCLYNPGNQTCLECCLLASLAVGISALGIYLAGAQPAGNIESYYNFELLISACFLNLHRQTDRPSYGQRLEFLREMSIDIKDFEIIYLSIALPYLNSKDKIQLKTYLRSIVDETTNINFNAHTLDAPAKQEMLDYSFR